MLIRNMVFTFIFFAVLSKIVSATSKTFDFVSKPVGTVATKGSMVYIELLKAGFFAFNLISNK